MAYLDLLVCFGVERGTNFPHWMLMAVFPGEQRGTWYHSTGGPTQNRDYTVEIQAGKRVDSRGIASTEKVGEIDEADLKKLKAAAQKVPPQQCQYYVTSLVAELERKGYVAKGHARSLEKRIQISATAQSYRDDHPVADPDISRTPSPAGSHRSSHRDHGSSNLRSSSTHSHSSHRSSSSRHGS